jgi:hypothetical protein
MPLRSEITDSTAPLARESAYTAIIGANVIRCVPKAKPPLIGIRAQLGGDAWAVYWINCEESFWQIGRHELLNAVLIQKPF